MNLSKRGYFLTGVMVSAVCFVILSLIVIKTPKLFDGIMWRVDHFQGNNNYTQRAVEHTLHKLYIWQDEFTPYGSVYLIGDSHLQIIPQHLTPWAVNYAINGQPMARIVQRIKDLPRLKRASAILVNGGENDLFYGTSIENIAGYWEAMFAQNPDIKKFVCIGLPETFATRRNAEKVAALNRKVEQICRANGAPFVVVRMGSKEFLGYGLDIDHVHLTREAMEPFAALLANSAKARAGAN